MPVSSSNRSSRPLYWQVADDIVLQIDNGAWQQGDKLPSERELCERYHVSQITVRRALRELDHLQRVYSRHGLGWFVAEQAAPTSLVDDIVLITPHLDWMQSSLVEMLHRRLAAQGIGVRLVFCQDDGSQWGELALAAQEQGARALLLIPTGHQEEIRSKVHNLAQQLHIPAMLWLYGIADCPLPSVTLDEQACMRIIAQHVLSLGHRQIAFAGTDPNTISGLARYQGLISMLYLQNMDVDYSRFFAGDLANGANRERFTSLFGQRPIPDVLVCASDRQAAQAMLMLRELGVYCPHDLAIVGLGDREFAPYLPTPLTTLRFDLDSIAQATERMLHQLLDGYTPESISYTGKLVVRQSCGAGA